MKLDAAAEQKLEEFKSTINSMILTDLEAAGRSVPHQPTIYHYTDVKGALGILQSGEFWFTERTNLNDPVEIQFGLSTAHKLYETAVLGSGPRISRTSISHLKGEHDFGLVAHGFWIFSTSLENDDLGQWRNYADDGKGVCLGFSIDFNMLDFAKNLPVQPNSLRFPVNYDANELHDNLQKYINLGLQLLDSVNLPERESYYEYFGDALLYERNFFRILNDGFFVHSLLTKHNAYHHEREYRLLISGPRNPIERDSHHQLRERNSEVVSYLSLPIPRWREAGVLTHLYIGPAAPDHLLVQLVGAIRTLGIPAPNNRGKSQIPYRSSK